MTEHTRTDGLPELPALPAAGAQATVVLDKSRPRSDRMAANKIECNACPVLCQITEGKVGACDRYANQAGRLVRLDPVLILQRQTVAEETVADETVVVPFLGSTGTDASGGLLNDEQLFVTGVGSSTTYPDYKPAPFIVSSRHQGVDMVTVVTEGIFSYCGVKLKIDTDRHLGPETATVVPGVVLEVPRVARVRQ